MTDPTADLLPEGLADRLPGAARALTRARRAALDAMDAHGYDRVRPPLVEFEKSLAGRMEGVATRRMVRFTDPRRFGSLHGVSGDPASHLELRAPRELLAVGEAIGFGRDEIASGLAEWGRLAAANRERAHPDSVEPGVRRGPYREDGG